MADAEPDAVDDAVIATRGLTKHYGDTVAVDHLDLEVRRGEVFGLLGPNGAGKTTTVLMLLGLSEPTSGSATVVGLDPVRHPLEVKRRIGYLPDSVGFYERLTGRQNLAYVARLNGLDDGTARDRIDGLLEQVGLADAADAPTGTYSRGMLQRLGIADALVKGPEVLILDEPTIAIDPRGVSRMLGLIRDLRDQHGVTVLLSSHLLHQVQEVCDRVGIFVRGRLVAQGAVRALSEQLAGRGHRYEVGVDGDASEAQRHLRGVPGVEEVARDGDLLVVTADRDVRAGLLQRLAAWDLPLVHLRRRGGDLDELYQRYFEEEGSDGGR